jgi:hypothetical protein
MRRWNTMIKIGGRIRRPQRWERGNGYVGMDRVESEWIVYIEVYL